MIRSRRAHEQGVTSLVIVVFSILLLVTMTVSFMQIMVSEQTRTDDAELSQGAYDSALAGVEDGKRVLTACQSAGFDPRAESCQAINNASCTTVSDAGLVNTEVNGEVYLKTNATGSNGTDFQQAYTCVIIRQQTSDYRGTLAQADSSVVVPLKSVAPFAKVQLFWRIPGIRAIDIDATPLFNLPILFDWNITPLQPRPALLRAQLIQYTNGSLSSADFDSDGNGHTLYLYPKQLSSAPALDFAADVRRSGAQVPRPAACPVGGTLPQGYHCTATIDVPSPLGGAPASRVAYLRLTSLYAPSDYMIRLVSSTGETVDFNGVQPSIDSTGRAADIFRRVDARVELIDPSDASLYPRATVDVTKNLCKVFTVSTATSDYSDGSSTCNPSSP